MSESGEALERLREIMARLRDPQTGCPWDREQDFATIAPYTIEEAYEVADAIAAGDAARIRDELGDLLFQIVFHARLAEERGWFDFAAVANRIAGKLTERHPHVFAGAHFATAAEQTAAWEAMKASERAAAGATHTLADIPSALPALARAARIGRRAARVGFDWPDAGGVREKIVEELRELDSARARESGARQMEELGDLLFAIANWARHAGLDPETALRDANRKFEARFRRMEEAAREAGRELATLDAAAWDALWVRAKSAEGTARD